MEPENPQFDGQSEALSKIQDAADKRKAAINKVINAGSRGETMDYSDSDKASDHEYNVLSGAPTDDLVKHINITDHLSAIGALVHLEDRTDVTPEHVSQIIMHRDPNTSHMAARLPQATDEHRALHALIHLNCKSCKEEK